MTDKNTPLTPRCIIGVACAEHRFIHGGEAEELREKFEKLQEELEAAAGDGDDGYSDGYASGLNQASCQIQRILSDVDARDSLAYLEVPESDEREFYILSLQNSQPEVLLWWKPEAKGYTVFLEHAGRYPLSALEANVDADGVHTLAIPCDEAERRAHLMVHVDDIAEFKKGLPART